ncbi:MAG: HupE/UreJ family protein [Acetobacteraceae bacterium]|nr:HupE/UreJ family protein [Acetobacteraceae bacterium]
MELRRGRAAAAAGAIVLGLPGLAHAHHAMGGAIPSTGWQGFVSGLAHPVIGIDHLAFLLAAGVLAAGVRRPVAVLALLSFVVAGAAGTLLHLAGVGLGPVEAVVALTALSAGLVLAVAPDVRRIGGAGLVIAFAIAGLFHGHAYAEAVVGAQAGPIGAYLVGLAIVQAVLGLGVMEGARRLTRQEALGFLTPRRALGAAAAVVGIVALAGAVA